MLGPQSETKMDKLSKLTLPELPDSPWIEDFKHAVYFIAGIYGAERVRDEQQFANNRGHSLSAEQIAEIFVNATKYMTEKVANSAGVGAIIQCPTCHGSGYVPDPENPPVPLSAGRGRGYGWVECQTCEGRRKINRRTPK